MPDSSFWIRFFDVEIPTITEFQLAIVYVSGGKDRGCPPALQFLGIFISTRWQSGEMEIPSWTLASCTTD